MWSVRKNKIITIITCVSIVLFTIICIIIAFIIGDMFFKDVKKSIFKSLSKYNHANNVIYYRFDYAYYDGKSCFWNYYENDYVEVCYIDNSYIIIYDFVLKKHKLLCMNGDKKSIDFKGKFGTCSAFFIKDSKIYFENHELKYYEYDIDSGIINEISAEDYLKYRNGNKHKIEMNEKKLVISNEFDDNKIEITKETINDAFNIRYMNLFMIDDYQIIDDCIYIKLYYKHFEIIIKYDIANNNMDLFDWFMHDNDRNYYESLDFYVCENKIPIIISRYFIL